MKNGVVMSASRTRSAWTLVVMFLALYVLSLLDRMIVLLVITPISESLHISLTQVGLLYGLGFGVLYAVIGLPVGHLLDRHHRIRIVTFGILLWSASTIASAFAPIYPLLVLCRSGVAIGEAVLTPAAISLIPDVFPKGRTTLPTTLYTLIGTLMSAGAFFIGGGALALATGLAPRLSIEAWRVTFIVVGAPGLLLGALLIALVREPVRTQVGRTESGEGFSNQQAMAYLAEHRRLWGGMFVTMCFAILGATSFVSWASTILVKAHGLPAAKAGLIFGLAGVFGASCGAAVWGGLAAQGARRGRADTLVVLLAVGAAVDLLAIVVFGLSHDLWPAIFTAGMAFFGMGAISVLPNLMIQTVAPAQMRARLTSGNLAANMVGVVIGSALVPWLAEHVYAGPGALGAALAAIGTALVPLVLVSLAVVRPAYVLAWRKVLIAPAAGEEPREPAHISA